MSLILHIKQIIWEWLQGTPTNKAPKSSAPLQQFHVFPPEHTKCRRWVVMCAPHLPDSTYEKVKNRAIGGIDHQRQAMVNTSMLAFSFQDFLDMSIAVEDIVYGYGAVRFCDHY